MPLARPTGDVGVKTLNSIHTEVCGLPRPAGKRGDGGQKL